MKSVNQEEDMRRQSLSIYESSCKPGEAGTLEIIKWVCFLPEQVLALISHNKSGDQTPE